MDDDEQELAVASSAKPEAISVRIGGSLDETAPGPKFNGAASGNGTPTPNARSSTDSHWSHFGTARGYQSSFLQAMPSLAPTLGAIDSCYQRGLPAAMQSRMEILMNEDAFSAVSPRAPSIDEHATQNGAPIPQERDAAAANSGKSMTDASSSMGASFRSAGVDWELPKISILTDMGGANHWRDERDFVEVEMVRREMNAQGGGGQLFVSHCWRDTETQLKKRLLIAELSKPVKEGGPGHDYWADWLDLQAEGPVPWRQEIEEGIRGCSKFVAMVDAAYLTSFNCLQELALAFEEGKPVVVLVLCQGAWDLLTVPGGAQKAQEVAASNFKLTAAESWCPETIAEDAPTPSPAGAPMEAPWAASRPRRAAAIGGGEGAAWKTYRGEAVPGVMSSGTGNGSRESSAAGSGDYASTLGSIQSRATSKVWGSRRFGAALAAYEEEMIIPGQPLSELVVKRLFARLSSINLCPCREQDVAVKGVRGVVEGALQFVGADLVHHKEHAFLKTMSIRWDAEGRPRTRLLRSDEAGRWELWLVEARKQGQEPQPSELQAEFVHASAKHARLKHWLWKCLMVLGVVLLGVAVSVSALLAFQRSRTAEMAEAASAMAMAGEQRALIAEEEARNMTKEVLIVSSAALLNGGSRWVAEGPRMFAHIWELKLAYALLSRLAGPHTPHRTPLAINTARSLLLLPAELPIHKVHLRTPASDSAAAQAHGEATQATAARALKWHPSGEVLAVAADGELQLLPVTNVSCDHLIFQSDNDLSLLRRSFGAGMEGTQGGIVALDWDSSGRVLATGGNDRAIWGWPYSSPEAQAAAPAPPFLLVEHNVADIMDLAWSPTGAHIATAGSDSAVRVWPLTWDTPAPGNSEEEGGPGVTGRDPGGPMVRVTGPPLVLKAPGHHNILSSISWSPDGLKVASVGWDADLAVWQIGGSSPAASGANPEDGGGDPVLVWIYRRPSKLPLLAVAWSPCGDAIAISGIDSTVSIFEDAGAAGDRFSDYTMRSVSVAAASRITSLSWNRDGKHLAAGAEDYNLYVVARDRDRMSAPMQIHEGGMPYASEGLHSSDEWVTDSVLTGHTAKILAVAWKPAPGDDRNVLASASADSTVKLWISTHHYVEEHGLHVSELIETLPGDGSPVSSVAWSHADGGVIASGSDAPMFAPRSSAKKSLQLWVKADSGVYTEGPRINGLEGVRALSFSPDGRLLASGIDKTGVKLWRVSNGGRAVSLAAEYPISGNSVWVCWSPDGLSLAAGSAGGEVKVYAVGAQPEQGPAAVQEARGVEGRPVLAIDWSPSGRHIAASTEARVVYIWLVQPNGTLVPEPVQVLRDRDTWVLYLAWSPSDKHLATSDVNGIVNIWRKLRDGTLDIAAGPQRIVPVRGAFSRLPAWSPDGSLLAVVDGGSVVDIWEVAEDEGVRSNQPTATITTSGNIGGLGKCTCDTITSVAWSGADMGTKLVVGTRGGDTKVVSFKTTDEMRCQFHRMWPRVNWTLSWPEVAAFEIPHELMTFPEMPLPAECAGFAIGKNSCHDYEH